MAKPADIRDAIQATLGLGKRCKEHSICIRFGLRTFLVVVVFAVSACGNGGATPTRSLASIILTTNPNPLIAGNVELTATVKDASGQPLDGAEVFV